MLAARRSITSGCNLTRVSDMENIFRPGKWFVLFCGVLVVVVVALRYVANADLLSEAKRVGFNIFTWYWPGDNWNSRAEITDAKVLEKGDYDAVVRVQGKQFLTVGDNAKLADSQAQAFDCSAI